MTETSSGAGRATARDELNKKQKEQLDKIPHIWVIAIVVIPYCIYGYLYRFAKSFTTGGASIYISLALIVAIGEALIGYRIDKIKRVNNPISGFKIALASLSVGLIVWNFIFAVRVGEASNAQVDWVQLVAFSLGVAYADWGRFPLSSEVNAYQTLGEVFSNYRTRPGE
jgi:hypothetical protein